jgi:probable HAF family extracellular repeat protein
MMVGYYFDAAGVRGFVSTGTTADDFTPIDFPGASATFASGINNSGQIVGWYTDETGTHGFLADPTVLRDRQNVRSRTRTR